MYLNNLGDILERQVEQSGEIKDLEDATDIGRRVV